MKCLLLAVFLLLVGCTNRDPVNYADATLTPKVRIKAKDRTVLDLNIGETAELLCCLWVDKDRFVYTSASSSLIDGHNWYSAGMITRVQEGYGVRRFGDVPLEIREANSQMIRVRVEVRQ